MGNMNHASEGFTPLGGIVPADHPAKKQSSGNGFSCTFYVVGIVILLVVAVTIGVFFALSSDSDVDAVVTPVVGVTTTMTLVGVAAADFTAGVTPTRKTHDTSTVLYKLIV